MDPRNSETIERFEESLQDWTDERFVSREQLKTMAMFHLYLVNLADHQGWVYRGHSWKESQYLGCLVVKAVVDDIPSVVFTNAKTSTAAMRIFLRKLEGDFLEWIVDKFA